MSNEHRAHRPPRGEPASPAYVVRIDQLELEGFPAERRYAIAAAFEQELTRLLGDGQAIRQPSGAQLTLGVPAAALEAFAPPVAIGRAIARAVYGGLSGTPSRRPNPSGAWSE